MTKALEFSEAELEAGVEILKGLPKSRWFVPTAAVFIIGLAVTIYLIVFEGRSDLATPCGWILAILALPVLAPAALAALFISASLLFLATGAAKAAVTTEEFGDEYHTLWFLTWPVMFAVFLWIGLFLWVRALARGLPIRMT